MEEGSPTDATNVPEQVAEGTEEEVNQEGDQNQNNDGETEAEQQPAAEEPTEESEVAQTTETPADDSEKAEAVAATPQSGGPEEGGEQQGEAEDKQGTDSAADESSPEVQADGGAEAEGQGEAAGAEEGGEAGAAVDPQVEEGDQKGEATGEAEATPEGEDTPESAGEGEAGKDSAVEGESGAESAEVEGQGEEQTPADKPPSSEMSEAERAESPVAVGVKLSREGSPSLVIDPDQMPEILEPGTPDRVSEAGEEGDQQELLEMEEDEGEEEDEPEFDREQLIERYHAAIQERDQLQQQNYQLQHKIAEYFRKKKSDDSRQDFDKNVSDQEQRYIKYMANLEELRKQEGQERENYRVQIEELKERCGDKQERVDGERHRFIDFKKQVAVNSLNSRSGKSIPPKDIEQYLSNENRKDNDVIAVRLENIKLKNKLKKKEQQLKSKEELAEGLHLIDFEQLKIENQTYNEKIEERNEELLKLRKKITSTVQVLTHLKEKLQFVQAENQVQNGRLKEVEAVAAQKRDVLSRTKQARDALRIDNHKLRQNCGLLGNESLLRDFEDQRDEGDDLKMKLDRLKMQHAELTLHCNQVRRKIEQVRLAQM